MIIICYKYAVTVSLFKLNKHLNLLKLKFIKIIQKIIRKLTLAVEITPGTYVTKARSVCIAKPALVKATLLALGLLST